MTTRLDSIQRSSTPLIVGHRGAPRAARENTLAGFVAAKSLGASMVELDVRFSADHQLVVHHDSIIKGLGAIIDLHRTDLPEYVPTLPDALSICRVHGLNVNIEIKNEKGEPGFDSTCALADAVVELLQEYPEQQRLAYLISSFHEPTLARVRALDPTMATAYLFSLPVPTVKSVIRRSVGGGYLALHPWWRCCTLRLIESAHEAGLRVNTWTVNDPAQMRVLIANGIDAIVTDVPDVASAMVAETRAPNLHSQPPT